MLGDGLCQERENGFRHWLRSLCGQLDGTTKTATYRSPGCLASAMPADGSPFHVQPWSLFNATRLSNAAIIDFEIQPRRCAEKIALRLPH